MANLARNTTGREVRPFDLWEDPFEDIFRGFFLQPMAMGPAASTMQSAFRADITENEREYRVHAELPGVRKEDINVTINGNEVAITAESRQEKDVKENGGRVLRSERHYGKLCRAFALGEEVDENRAEAKYTDGVLELVLPKKADDSAKRKRLAIR